MSADIEELIGRLGNATGPDHELDAEIWMTLNPAWRAYPRTKAGGWFTPDGGTRPAEPYTSSIDAALTLVPEGWAWSVRDGGCYATGKPLSPHAELAEPVQTEYGPGVGVRAQIDAATPAIALCIAALRALSATNTGK